MNRLVTLVLGLALAGASGCQPGTPEPEAWFSEVAGPIGLDFAHASGHVAERYWMPEIMGGGAALLDADGDGLLDVYCVQSGSLDAPSQRRDALYHNRGDLRFTRAAALPPLAGYGMGAAVGDVDGDGDPDVYVTALGPNALLRNEGDLSFANVAPGAGVDHAAWGTSAAFLDIDADGALDLYVANYLDWTPEREITCRGRLGTRDYCSPLNYRSPALDVIYRNDGDGRFTDISEVSGVASVPGTGLGVTCGDFDADGRTDIFVANDGMPDFLWHNRGAARFEERALASGCALDQSGVAKAGMGVAAIDFDDDADLDLFICNLAEQTDSLFVNGGDGVFVDRTLPARLGVHSKPFTRFGTGLVDFDHDGWLDLFEANGRVTQNARRFSADPFAEPNLLYRGTADGVFERVPNAGLAQELVGTSRAAAFGDLDNDGDVDVVVINRDERLHLLRNNADDERWVGFILSAEGRPALGTTLSVRLAGRRITRVSQPAYSYLAANDARIQIGLGQQVEPVELEVRWPDGSAEHFGPLERGRYHTLVQGRGAPSTTK